MNQSLVPQKNSEKKCSHHNILNSTLHGLSMINIYIVIYIKEYWLKKTHGVSFGIMKQKKKCI